MVPLFFVAGKPWREDGADEDRGGDGLTNVGDAAIAPGRGSAAAPAPAAPVKAIQLTCVIDCRLARKEMLLLSKAENLAKS